MSDEIDIADAEDERDHFGENIRDHIDTDGHWLDYKIERELTSMPPPPRLLRFMPLEQYVALLTTKQLYFPRATEYDDPYDCAFNGSLAESIKQALVDTCDEPQFSFGGEVDHFAWVQDAEETLQSELYDKFADEVPNRWFVSCWHADSDNLKDLLWRSYGGHKGVCISIDGPALLAQIQASVWAKRDIRDDERGTEHFDFMASYVEYGQDMFEIDSDDSGPIVRVRHPAFCKHRFFSMDEEFRFAVRLNAKYPDIFSVGAPLDLMACGAQVSTSPLCPAWIAQSIEALTKKYYPKLSVDHLNLEPQ